MGGISSKALLLLIGRLALAWVFIWAAIPKLQDPVAFSASIEGYRIVSGSLAMWAAIILPWLELVVGLGLITPWLRQASAGTMASLLLLFVALHASAWARGLDINCGCFGESTESPGYHWLILRNLALLSITIFILRAPRRNKTTPEGSN